MSVMPIVTAALAPILTFLKAIPMYECERKTLATLSGILGFLLLAWLFYVRRTIALGSLMKGFRFFINMLPLFLIIGTLAAYLGYSQLLQQSLDSALEQAKNGQKQHNFQVNTGRLAVQGQLNHRDLWSGRWESNPKTTS